MEKEAGGSSSSLVGGSSSSLAGGSSSNLVGDDPLHFELWKQAAELLWNFKIAESLKVYRTYEKESAMFAHGVAECLWTVAIITEDKDDVKKAFDALTAARALSKKTKDVKTIDEKNPSKITLILADKVVAAHSYLLDGFLKLKLQQKVKGSFALRKAWKSFESAFNYKEKVPSTIPNYNDLKAYCDYGTGIFLFLVSIVPTQWLWIVETIGFQGDRDRGYALLSGAANSLSPVCVEPHFHLIWIATFFQEDLHSAKRMVEEVLQRYPNCCAARYEGVYVSRKLGDLEGTEKYLNILKKDGAEVPQFLLFVDYDLGLNSFLSLEWHKALEILVPFWEKSQVPGFRTFCCYMIAVSNEMLFQHDKATQFFKLVLPLVRKGYDYDEFAERKAKQYLANKGFTMSQRKLLIGMVHFEACRWADAVDAADAAQPVAESVEETAQCHYIRGAGNVKLDKLDEATKAFDEVFKLEKQIKNETWVIPHAYVQLGEVNLKAKKYDEAEKFFKKAKTYSNYDFSQLQQWKIMKGLEQIQRLQKSPK